MEWITALISWLISWTARPKAPPKQVEAPAEPATAETPAPSAGNGGGEDSVYANAPEEGIGQAKQHKWLFGEGVLHWNQRRIDHDFKPAFPGLNFVKESAKTRLWGRPLDLVGEERVVLTGVDWRFANLQGCILTRADLRNAQLQAADLRNANLAGANLSGADMTDCDLRGAVLDGAILARVRLVNANLSTASLKNANFAWADLRRALFGSKNLSEAQTFGVVRDDASSPHVEPVTISGNDVRALRLGV